MLDAILTKPFLCISCELLYSKNPHIRTPIFGVQADWVLIYRVF